MSSHDYHPDNFDALDLEHLSFDWQPDSDSQDPGSSNQADTFHSPSAFGGFFPPYIASQVPHPFTNDMPSSSTSILQPNASEHAALQSTPTMAESASFMTPTPTYSSPIQSVHTTAPTAHGVTLSVSHFGLCPECAQFLYSHPQNRKGQITLFFHSEGISRCGHLSCNQPRHMTTINESPHQSLFATEIDQLSHPSLHTGATIGRPDTPRPTTLTITTPAHSAPAGGEHLCTVTTCPRSQKGFGFPRKWNRDMHVRACAQKAAEGTLKRRRGTQG